VRVLLLQVLDAHGRVVNVHNAAVAVRCHGLLDVGGAHADVQQGRVGGQVLADDAAQAVVVPAGEFVLGGWRGGACNFEKEGGGSTARCSEAGCGAEVAALGALARPWSLWGSSGECCWLHLYHSKALLSSAR